MPASKALISPEGRFTWTARWFALQLALVAPFVHAHLRLFGYNRTLAMLQRFVPTNPAPTAPYGDPETYASAVRRLVRQVRHRSPLPGTCLSRSLSLWWKLQRCGIEAKLRIGTRKDSPSFQAHAWVEYHGQPLNAGRRVRQQYVAFDRAL